MQVPAISRDGRLSHHFEDSFGVDVTSEVENTNEGADILDVVVRDSTVNGSHVTFTLDYTDQTAACWRG